MSILKPEYIGKKQYYQAYFKLWHTVANQKLITYGELAKYLGWRPSGSHMQRNISQLLGEISENEVKHHRPMLSSIVVNSSTGRPGKGYFDLACDLGKESASDNIFWRSELKKVYDISKYFQIKEMDENIIKCIIEALNDYNDPYIPWDHEIIESCIKNEYKDIRPAPFPDIEEISKRICKTLGDMNILGKPGDDVDKDGTEYKYRVLKNKI